MLLIQNQVVLIQIYTHAKNKQYEHLNIAIQMETHYCYFQSIHIIML